MTVQFNLLPDIKVQYLKAKRQKHLVVLASVTASIVAVTVFVILLVTVFMLQKKNISDLNKDIKTTSSQLQSVQDLDKILTVQNQLNTLPGLHDDKVVSSRLTDFLPKITPATVSISKLDVDFAQNTMTIAGSTNELTAVNILADTLKFAKYNTKDNTEAKTAFSKVVLTSFGRTENSATYEISFKFDSVIFSNIEGVNLIIDPATVTASQASTPEQPAFEEQQTEQGGAQ